MNFKRDFQAVKDSRNKIIQEDIFSDLKIPIIINMLLVSVFFLLSIATLFMPENKFILMIFFTVLFIATFFYNYKLVKKIKITAEKYRKIGEELIKKAEQR